MGAFHSITMAHRPPEEDVPVQPRYSKSLAEAVQDLPPELFNDIRALVFSCPSAEHDITGRRKQYSATNTSAPTAASNAKALETHYQAMDTLNCLQVSRATRVSFAEQYYGNGASFIIYGHRDSGFESFNGTPTDPNHIGPTLSSVPGFQTFVDWYPTLDVTHQLHVKTITFSLPRAQDKTENESLHYWSIRLENDLRKERWGGALWTRDASRKIWIRLHDEERAGLYD